MQKIDKKKVVVVIPTFNEKITIEKLISLIFDQQKNTDYEFNVLVVDSSSPDGTGEIVGKLSKENPKIHLLTLVERGHGKAVIEGYKYAVETLKADVVVQIDGDLQHDPRDLPKFLEKIDQGFDYVQGSRYVKGGVNEISPVRQIFSIGSSIAMRVLTGIWQINDFTPAFKAISKNLYQRIDWNNIPWHGTTFLIHPAMVIEAVRAGAKMVQVSIKFSNRTADKSKNEIWNYIIDILGFGIEVRFSKMGIKFPMLFWARRSKTFIKFGAVGFTGTVVDFIFYNIFISYFAIRPATSKGFSTEIAIINNFFLNNIWTFKKRKTKNTFWQKMLIFNLVSFGGLAIAVVIVKVLHMLYGDGVARILFIKLQYYNLYFFATIPFVMVWNFLMNHLFTWKKEEIS